MSERLTNERIVVLREHIETATDTPWGRHRDEIMRLDVRPDAKHEFMYDRVLAMKPWDDNHDPLGESQEEVDVALMVAAVNALPGLLDEVEMLRKRCKFIGPSATVIAAAVKSDREAIKSLIGAVTMAHNMGDPDVLLYSNKDVAGILENIAAIIDGMNVGP